LVSRLKPVRRPADHAIMSPARRLAVALAAVVAVTTVPSAALAATKVTATLKAGDRSPVAFGADLLPDGGAPVLAKGAKLKDGQTIEVVRLTGRDVPPPGDCGCTLQPGEGLSGVKGSHLVNVRVRAVRNGRTVALSDPAHSEILDTAALDYAWPSGTAAFKPGTRLLVYALFAAN
jgi:hypothetical protein